MSSRVYGFAMVLTLVISAFVVACGEQPTPTTVSPTASPTPLSTAPSLADTPIPPPASTVPPPTETAVSAATMPALTETAVPAATKPAPFETPAPAPTEPAAAPTGVMLEADPEDVVSIILNEDNASGQSGWAALTAKGNQTEVVLSLPSGNLETELVHIHSGSCGADTLGGVEHGLTSFVDGSGFSVTTVDAPLSSLRTGDFAVNSHKKGEPGVYTSCGNIPREAEALTIALDPENESGQSGWATLTARGDKTDVVLYITPGSLATELVHIHSGRCGADTLGGVEHGLTSFAGGSGVSATTVDAALSRLRTGDFAVNSHKKGEPGVYASCGNIPAGQEMATPMPSSNAYSLTMANNFTFSPNTLEVKAGQKAQLMLTSDGRGHTFTVESLGLDVVVAPGTTQTIEFEVPASASGTIAFRCRYHSNGGRGMVGELKIMGTSSPGDDPGGDY